MVDVADTHDEGNQDDALDLGLQRILDGLETLAAQRRGMLAG